MLFRHELGVVRVNVVLLHGELVQDDLQEVQRDDTDGKQDERGQLGEAEDHVQDSDNADDGCGIGHLRTDVVDMVSTGEDGGVPVSGHAL